MILQNIDRRIFFFIFFCVKLNLSSFFFSLIEIRFIVVDYEEKLPLNQFRWFFYYSHLMASSIGMKIRVFFNPIIWWFIIGHDYFVCHFCFNKFPDYSFLLSHFPDCHSKNSIKRNEEIIRPPRLNKVDRDLLQSNLSLLPSSLLIDISFFSSSVEITSFQWSINFTSI